MREDSFSLLSHHVKVSHETVDRLSIYHDLLVKWQSKINLVSSDSIADAWSRHFLDSAQLLNHIPSSAKTIVDLGSGAGFPGLVIAICSGKNVHLIESDAKKSVFLKEAARLTKTQVTIHTQRIETITLEADIVLARACTNLNQLLKLSSPFVSHGTTCLFHKGKNWSMEIDDAKKEWSFDCNVLPSVTDKEAAILKISNLCGRTL